MWALRTRSFTSTRVTTFLIQIPGIDVAFPLFVLAFVLRMTGFVTSPAATLAGIFGTATVSTTVFT
jgi:hypothetical protein